MKRIFTFLVTSLLVASAAQVQAQNRLYPGLADSTFVYKAPKTAVAPVIDGDPSDDAWKLAPWKSAMRVNNANNGWSTVPRVEPTGPFAGVADCEFKYKFIWDNDKYYMLMYWKDDVVIYADKHNGYGKMPVMPAFLTGVTIAANGAGDGTSYNSWEMDQISLIFTNYDQTFVNGTGFNRANTSLWYSFYPAKVTHSTEAEAVLWTQSNNLKTTGAPIQNTRRACKYNSVEKAYYIEFADTTWTTLFSTVKNAPLTTQKNFATTPVAVGDKFLFSGEINDADGTTNRRDYSLFVSAKTTNPNSNATESVIIELVEKSTVGIGELGVKKGGLEIYPNPNSTGILNLNRAADVEIFNVAGQMVLKSLNASRINIAGLIHGVYFVKDNDGNIQKMIRK